MGIGRREFIRLSTLALAGLAIDPLQAVTTTNDLYINKALGIMFKKPAAWGYIKVTDFGKIKQNQILKGQWNEVKDWVYEELGDPICITTKYFEDTPDTYGIFSPTITLHVTPKEEINADGSMSFEELIKLSQQGTGKVLNRFKVINAREPISLNGHVFYEYEASYLFKHIELRKPLPVELMVLKTEHNGMYYDFNFHQSNAQNQVAMEDYELF